MIRDQFRLTFDNELIVDLFAGGGGMSTAIEHALGRAPDIAINHNEQALSMHQANHPQTAHYIADVYEVCPHEATNGTPVGYLHLSPDCTHHSQAADGQPLPEGWPVPCLYQRDYDDPQCSGCEHKDKK